MAEDERVLHHGRVVGANGAGAASALVFVARGTAPTPEIAIRCDKEGRFRLALPPGRFVIEAQSAEGAIGSLEIETGMEAQSFWIMVADRTRPGAGSSR